MLTQLHSNSADIWYAQSTHNKTWYNYASKNRAVWLFSRSLSPWFSFCIQCTKWNSLISFRQPIKYRCKWKDAHWLPDMELNGEFHWFPMSRFFSFLYGSEKIFIIQLLHYCETTESIEASLFGSMIQCLFSVTYNLLYKHLKVLKFYVRAYKHEKARR